MQPNTVLNSHEMGGNTPQTITCGASLPGPSARRRFWEIDCHFRCPVVGLCLDLTEQKQLLKKVNISAKRKGLFEIHEILVGHSETENPLSRRMDSVLNSKFSDEAKALQGLAENEFLDHWRSSFRVGEFKAVFWVAAIRADLSNAAKREIFGDVHMEMHDTAKRAARLKRLLAFEQALRQKAAEKLKNDACQWSALQRENADLQIAVRKLTLKLSAAEKEKTVLYEEVMGLKGGTYEILDQENHRLRAGIEDLSRTLAEYKRRLAVLEEENRELAEKWTRQSDLSAHLQDQMGVVLQRCQTMSKCEESCPSFDLCRKRVLIVGGVTRMESLYRELIEGSGGVFEYHDGNIKNGSRKLESSLKRADVILCPLNCNSHAACQMVKKLGKKYNKPIHLLASSSLNGVSQVLGGEWTARPGGVLQNDMPSGLQ